MKERDRSVDVDKSDVEFSRKLAIKDPKDFGSAELPHALYEYDIVAKDRASGKQVDFLDPDLDITPPIGITGRRRGRGGR